MQSKIQRRIGVLFIILLIADLSYSFVQHLHMPLKGDMAEIVLPTPNNGYYEVLHNPFGYDALVKGKQYANPNRFFAHWTTSNYFLTVPLLLQNFTNPIDSVYLSNAIAKILIQLIILYLFALYISGSRQVFRFKFLLAAILIAPLFQTSGYSRFLGIIDQSVIYTFFYALPQALIMLFFYPFFKYAYYNYPLNFSLLKHIIWTSLMIFLSFNGPLLTGVALITSMLFIFFEMYKKFDNHKETTYFKKLIISFSNIPLSIRYYAIGISILSLYSLYIGQSNSLNFGESAPLLERYSRLPIGIYNLISQKLAYPLLFILLGINIFIIRKNYRNKQGSKILSLIAWMGVFAFIYILLLPLGGFRSYRPNIIRYDTILPLTFGLILSYGMSTYFLIIHIIKKYRIFYFSTIILFLIVFTYADKYTDKDYFCERNALEVLSKSQENPVILNSDCSIMEWKPIHSAAESELNATLFQYWNITKEKKLYYQK